ncbi:c-type cytochrome [Roseinatronobacter monicus]|uniref:c-type cytochrome n=1 Tax=Roseinatronobacter monicus TaxID=393481 RepID=UPI003F2F80CD
MFEKLKPLILVGALLAPTTVLGQATPIGDAAAGAQVYQRECASCHQIGDGAEHRIGPHLNRIFDRRAGSHDDFRYSEALVRQGRDGLFWDLARLHAYIENPRALVSGTRMSYRGLRDKERRANLIAYMRAYSDQPQNIPEASPTAIAREVELSAETLAIEGDVEYGEFLSAECTTCHQRSGEHSGIPGIVGWPEEDFVVAMHAYKQKLRPHEVMQSVTQRLDDEEIAALAAFFRELGRE